MSTMISETDFPIVFQFLGKFIIDPGKVWCYLMQGMITLQFICITKTKSKEIWKLLLVQTIEKILVFVHGANSLEACVTPPPLLPPLLLQNRNIHLIKKCALVWEIIVKFYFESTGHIVITKKQIDRKNNK